jgi:hypothetical protein
MKIIFYIVIFATLGFAGCNFSKVDSPKNCSDQVNIAFDKIILKNIKTKMVMTYIFQTHKASSNTLMSLLKSQRKNDIKVEEIRQLSFYSDAKSARMPVFIYSSGLGLTADQARAEMFGMCSRKDGLELEDTQIKVHFANYTDLSE